MSNIIRMNKVVFYALFLLLFSCKQDTGTKVVIAPVVDAEQSLPKTYTSFAEAVKMPNAMRVLDLSRNELAEFPMTILPLQKLEFLALNNNQISSIPKEIKRLQKLETLFIFENKMEKRPEALDGLPNLKNE